MNTKQTNQTGQNNMTKQIKKLYQNETTENLLKASAYLAGRDRDMKIADRHYEAVWQVLESRGVGH